MNYKFCKHNVESKEPKGERKPCFVTIYINFKSRHKQAIVFKNDTNMIKP